MLKGEIRERKRREEGEKKNELGANKKRRMEKGENR